MQRWESSDKTYAALFYLKRQMSDAPQSNFLHRPSCNKTSLNLYRFSPTCTLTSSALRGTVPYPHAQSAGFVQVPELDKLLRHGMKPFIG